jgi:hypothetical protein
MRWGANGWKPAISVSIHKRLFRPTPALCSKFYPWNINYMPVVKFAAARLTTAPIRVTVINISVHPQTVISPDIFVMLKILSLEYQLYACGKIFRRL